MATVKERKCRVCQCVIAPGTGPKWRRLCDTHGKERACKRSKAWRLKNVEKHRSYARAYVAAHPEWKVAYERQYHTGWSKEAFDVAWLEQCGLCACCGEPMQPYGRAKTSVTADHNHTTGAPRGLLCRTCNILVGYYEKHHGTPDVAGYLAQFEPKASPVVLRDAMEVALCRRRSR